jgi:4-diphosphocytidyl-2C-methyl-D-erythritol kinase
MVARTGERVASDIPVLLAEGLVRPHELRATIVNDFEPAIFEAHPLLAEIKDRLYAAGALFALMSGSGSTMFGLFADDANARRAADHFKDYWSVVARQSHGSRFVRP